MRALFARSNPLPAFSARYANREFRPIARARSSRGGSRMRRVERR